MSKATQVRAEPGLDPCSPHPGLLPQCSTHSESEGKGVKPKPENTEQKRKKRAAGPCGRGRGGAEKSKMKVDIGCSMDSTDIEGDVTRDGLRPGWLGVSPGVGPRRDDHHPIAGPPGHGRLCKLQA